MLFRTDSFSLKVILCKQERYSGIRSPFFFEDKKQNTITMQYKPGKTIILYNQTPELNSRGIKLFRRDKVQKQNLTN